MKKQEKIIEVENLKAKIKEAKGITLADYKGINFSQLSQLREKIKEAGGRLQVVKNNLLYRALRESQLQVEKKDIEGSTLALFADQDEVLPLKILATFAKTTNLLPFKIGFMAGNTLKADELNRLASLPTRIELQTKLVGLLFSQPNRLAYALNWNLQRLVLVLNGIKTKKQ